jgi:hypothetical protein
MIVNEITAAENIVFTPSAFLLCLLVRDRLALTRLDCFLPLVISPGLVAVATTLHVAPTAPMVLGFVQEQPRAGLGRTLPHVADFLANEQLRRSSAHWPEHRVQVAFRIDPFPGKPPVGVDELGVLRGLADSLVEDREGRTRYHPSLRDRREDVVNRVAELYRGAQHGQGVARRFGSQMTQAFRSFRGDHTGLFSPLQKPSIVGEQLPGMVTDAVVDSVGEIQTGISSRELERRFRPDW